MTRLQKALLFAIILLASFLRFYRIASNPPGLYWDEVVNGYDAYSISQIARDHHGHFLPLFFESFGDWKLPGYIYTLVPVIKIFGLNEFSVRLPSVFASIGITIFSFLIARTLTKNISLSLLVSFFLAISPWQIQFSRGGFEANLGLFFALAGIYFFLQSLESKRLFSFFSSFMFLVLSMYTYHTYRIFVPALAVIFFLLNSNLILQLKIKILISSILPLIILIPLAVFTLSPQGRIRAISESPYRESTFKQAKHDYDQKSKHSLRFISGYIYKKPLYYSYLTINSYFDHFSPVFLFTRGDQTGRHSQVDMGQTYLFEALLVAASLFALNIVPRQSLKLMLGILIISPFAAMFTGNTPHALRALPLVIPLEFFSALGAYYLFSKKNYLLTSFLIIIISFSFTIYLHLLFVHYPKNFGPDWQEGNREMVRATLKYQSEFKKVYVTDIYTAPYIYFLFYTKYDPNKFVQEGTNLSFDKYNFVPRNFNVYDQKQPILYVAPPFEKVNGTLLDEIYNLQGNSVYKIWRIDAQI